MVFLQKKKFLEFVESRRFSYLWEEVERHFGKEFNCVQDFFEACINSLTVSSKQQNNDVLKNQFESEISNIRIEELRSSISNLEKELNENGEVVKMAHNQISSFVSYAVESLDLIQRLEYDKHLSDMIVLDSIKQSSIKILSDNGYTLLNETGTPFNSKTQNIISVSPTNDIKLEGVVAESLKFGVLKDGKCIRSQDVVVYKYNE